MVTMARKEKKEETRSIKVAAEGNKEKEDTTNEGKDGMRCMKD